MSYCREIKYLVQLGNWRVKVAVSLDWQFRLRVRLHKVKTKQGKDKFVTNKVRTEYSKEKTSKLCNHVFKSYLRKRIGNHFPSI
jgi:hypothetical protein